MRPDGVVIDAGWQIPQFRGHTGFYLETSGEAANEEIGSANEELRSVNEQLESAREEL